MGVFQEGQGVRWIKFSFRGYEGFCGFVGCFRVFDIGLYIILGVFLAVSLNTSICMDKIGVSSFILVNKITKISHKSITYTILHTIKKYPKNFPKKTP